MLVILILPCSWIVLEPVQDQRDHGHPTMRRQGRLEPGILFKEAEEQGVLWVGEANPVSSQVGGGLWWPTEGGPTPLRDYQLIAGE